MNIPEARYTVQYSITASHATGPRLCASFLQPFVVGFDAGRRLASSVLVAFVNRSFCCTEEETEKRYTEQSGQRTTKTHPPGQTTVTATSNSSCWERALGIIACGGDRLKTYRIASQRIRRPTSLTQLLGRTATVELFHGAGCGQCLHESCLQVKSVQFIPFLPVVFGWRRAGKIFNNVELSTNGWCSSIYCLCLLLSACGCMSISIPVHHPRSSTTQTRVGTPLLLSYCNMYMSEGVMAVCFDFYLRLYKLCTLTHII